MPVIATVALAARSSLFRTMLDHAPLVIVVGVQTFRLGGAAFLLIVCLVILPPAFARAGYGDLTTLVLIPALATPVALLLHLLALRSYLRSEASIPLRSAGAAP